MCGIYGCIGKNAYDKVVSGLEKLVYRGCDSCGVAYYDKGFKINKTIGGLENLEKIKTNSRIAFGHTRWATTGAVIHENAHPHQSQDKSITIVHNGTITNSDKIKQELIKEDIAFLSETDTEVIANYIAYKIKENSVENVLKSLYTVMEGNFSLIIADNNGDIYLLKRSNPLNILTNKKKIFISSDVLSLTDGKLYSLEDGDVIKITKSTIESIDSKNLTFIDHKNNYKQSDLNGYKHFMEKEIFETPKAIKETYKELKDSKIIDVVKSYKKLTIIGCGSAYHAGLIGEYLFKHELEMDVNSCVASNYSITNQIDKTHLHILVSQSGETADCIKVAENIKEFGGKILVVTNEKLSVLARMADYLICTRADREVAIASTKTYSSQVFVFAYICKKIKDENYILDIDSFEKELYKYISNLNVDEYAHSLFKCNNLLMIAKDLDYLTIYEACLKIRETNYIFTLPMYAGELKHGTIALIEKDSAVLALNTSENELQLQNAVSAIKAREGVVYDFSSLINKNIDMVFKPIFAIIPFQLLSYKMAILKNLNPDKPRNLTKSVTIE